MVNTDGKNYEKVFIVSKRKISSIDIKIWVLKNLIRQYISQNINLIIFAKYL